MDLTLTELVYLPLEGSPSSPPQDQSGSNTVVAPGQLLLEIVLKSAGHSDDTSLSLDLLSILPAGVTSTSPAADAAGTWSIERRPEGEAVTLEVIYDVSRTVAGGIDVLGSQLAEIASRSTG